MKFFIKLSKFRPASTRKTRRREAGVARALIMSYIYILKSLNYKKLYVGSTTDLNRRLDEHNSSSSYYTKGYMPWVVIYTEKCINIEDARKRERYLKSAAGRRFIKKNIDIPG